MVVDDYPSVTGRVLVGRDKREMLPSLLLESVLTFLRHGRFDTVLSVFEDPETR